MIDEINNISALRVDLYDCITQRAAEILKPHIPENTINNAWIPQTMGVQIWVLYEFKTELARVEWENGLPDLIKSWLDRTLLDHALSYGWNTRDANGFVVNK